MPGMVATTDIVARPTQARTRADPFAGCIGCSRGAGEPRPPLCPVASPLAGFWIEGTLTARARTIAVLGVPAQAQEATWRHRPPATHPYQGRCRISGRGQRHDHSGVRPDRTPTGHHPGGRCGCSRLMGADEEGTLARTSSRFHRRAGQIFGVFRRPNGFEPCAFQSGELGARKARRRCKPPCDARKDQGDHGRNRLYFAHFIPHRSEGRRSSGAKPAA
jgi:hypothetical protein